MKLYIAAGIILIIAVGFWFSYDYGNTQCVNHYLESSNETAQAFQKEMRRVRNDGQTKLNKAQQEARTYKARSTSLLREALNTKPTFKAYYDAPVHSEAINIIFGSGSYSDIAK